jgi:hypothetical protein
MADVLFAAGQALSMAGLVYGWYLALTYCDHSDEMRAERAKAALLHHLAMA